ncbi:MAG: branched-chain amino acid ABC transporter permease [Candidatus Hodarchaeota archaeon]
MATIGIDIMNMLFNGTLTGAVYALIAMGYSLVYGVGGIMNLSHGAYFMLTGYLLLWMLQSPFFLGLEWLTVIIALIVITVIGGLTFLLLIKPLQDSHVAVVIATFGLAFLLEQIVIISPSGTEVWSIGQLEVLQGFTMVLGYPIVHQYVFLIIMSIIIVLLFALFINKSRLGKSIRAVSQDREAAELMGINSNRILLYTVMISALLAGVAAFMYLPGASLDGPAMGWGYLTNSFAIVILGGMGSLVGSVVGAFIVGYIIQFTNVFIPNGPSWAHLVPIIIIVIILLIRPQGLFGKKELR